MVDMSVLLCIWWSGDCWRVVGGYIYVLSGLPCCGTSGCSLGIAQHHAVHTPASAVQQYTCAFSYRSLYGSIYYILGTVSSCLAGLHLAAVGHTTPALACISHASLSWRGIHHTISLLVPLQPSGLCRSGLSIFSGVPLVGCGSHSKNACFGM